MLSRILTQLPARVSRYIVSGILIMGVFVVGLVLGNTIKTALGGNEDQSSMVDAMSENTDTPSGGALVDPPHQVQDFTLTGHTGEPISLSDLRGKPVLMFFGYTHCPDVCPATLANYVRVKRSLGDKADEVAFVFITVDGERDTPEVISEYLRQFDEDFIGMVGDETTLRSVGAEYGLMTQRTTPDVAPESDQTDDHTHAEGHAEGDHLDQDNYFVQHTSPSFLIDANGYLRVVYFYGTKPDVIARGIEQYLR